MFAGAAADIEETGALVMAVMDTPVERRLETIWPVPANADRIADKVEWCWLLDDISVMAVSLATTAPLGSRCNTASAAILCRRAPRTGQDDKAIPAH